MLTAGILYGDQKDSIIEALTKISLQHLTPQFVKYFQALKEKGNDPIGIISYLGELAPETLTDAFMKELMEDITGEVAEGDV